MTNEQQRAVDLATEIGKLGGFVVSITPPPTDNLIVRFQVLASDDERIIGELKGWGWSPQLTGNGPRFSVLGTVNPCNSYMIRILPERTPVHDGRIVGDLAQPKDVKSESELAKMQESMGMKK